MPFSLTFLEHPRFSNTDSGPRLVPKYPESLWLNWAIALVAQAGWMLYGSPQTEPGPSVEYGKSRDSWAEKILLSAALHNRREGQTTFSAYTNNLDGTVAAEAGGAFQIFLEFKTGEST